MKFEYYTEKAFLKSKNKDIKFCMILKIFLNLKIYQAIDLMGKVFANCPGDWDSIPG